MAPACLDGIDEGIGIIPLVGDHVVRPDALDQGFRLAHLATLARADQQPHRIAQSIDRRMNLGAQAPSRLAHRFVVAVFFLKPRADGRARCSRRPSDIRDRDRLTPPRISVSSGPCGTSDYSAHIPGANGRTAAAGPATASPCARSTAPPRQTSDCPSPSPPDLPPCPAANP